MLKLICNLTLFAEPRIVVLETGTSGLRAGFAGAETAAAVIPFSPNVSAYVIYTVYLLPYAIS